MIVAPQFKLLLFVIRLSIWSSFLSIENYSTVLETRLLSTAILLFDPESWRKGNEALID